MKIVSQNINIFNPKVYEAVKARDSVFVRKLARRMVENGADCMEVNLGGWNGSALALPWMVKQIRMVSDCPLFVSATAESMKDVVEAAGAGSIFINCVTADVPRLESMLNASKCLGTSMVVLLTRKDFVPAGLDQVLLLANEVLERADRIGLPMDRLVLDPVLRPRLSLSTTGSLVNRPDVTFYAEAIALIGMLRDRKVLTAAGLGNLSAGMDSQTRKSLERSAAALLMSAGLDYCITDCSNRAFVRQVKSCRPMNLWTHFQEAQTSIGIRQGGVEG